MKKEIDNLNNELENSNDKIMVLYDIQSSEIKTNKVAPKDRWFNTTLSFMIAIGSIMIGVIIVCLIILYV